MTTHDDTAQAIEDAQASITYHRLHIQRLERIERKDGLTPEDADNLRWHKTELSYWNTELKWITD